MTDHLKTGAEPIPETSCMSYKPQTMDNIQRNIGIVTRDVGTQNISNTVKLVHHSLSLFSSIKSTQTKQIS